MKIALITIFATLLVVIGLPLAIDFVADWFCALVPDLVLSSILLWGLIIWVIIYAIKFAKEALND